MTSHQLHKKTRFYKKPLFIIFSVIVILGVILYLVFRGGETGITYDFVEAEKGELIQEVSVTGRVEPSESVNLSFEISGKVAEIFADVGDRVEAGQKLISLNSGDISAQLRQAQAGAASAQAMIQQYEAAVKSQEAKLEELRKGARPEEIQIAETAVDNAEKTLENAEINLENIKSKTEIDLQQVYSSALNSLPQAVNSGKTALITLTEIQYAHFSGASLEDNQIANAKAEAVYALLGASNAGRWNTQYISTQNGGLYAEVQNLILSATNEKIDTVLISALGALQKVKYALNVIPVSDKLTSTEKTSLSTAKSAIDTEIATVSGYQQSIAVQKATNENSISTAETSVNNAKNALATAKDQLKLKRAGYTKEQIAAQEAQVDQAKANLASQRAMANQAYANVQNYQAQLAKTVLYAPISGLITKMEAKVGEVVFPSSPYSDSRVTFVSIISDVNYEIEVNVSEVDIAKIKIGDTARITLDAYGDEEEFHASVISIEPAETLVEGIPTYKVKLQFDGQDERIKSGMTANIDILTAKKEDVITIPQRAVINKGGDKIVRLVDDLTEEGITNINEVIVKTGLRGSDGRIEIIEGIKEGDKVITSISDGE
jgi:RND family efflux transporter MFP subunit